MMTDSIPGTSPEPRRITARLLLLLSGLLIGCDYVPSSTPPTGPVSGLTPVDRAGFDQVIASHAGKVILVDFWASWCPPCQRAFPHTVDLYAQHRQQGFEVVSVSLDAAIDESKAQRFLQTVGADFDNLISIWGNSLKSYSEFEIPDAIPFYTLYDRQGRLRYRFSPLFPPGQQGNENPTSIDQRVLELLAE